MLLYILELVKDAAGGMSSGKRQITSLRSRQGEEKGGKRKDGRGNGRGQMGILKHLDGECSCRMVFHWDLSAPL